MTQPDFIPRIATGSTGRATLSFEVIPIILVPGVMGSRLSVPGGNDWDPDTATAMLGWASANLNQKKQDLSVVIRPSLALIGTFSGAARADIANDSTLQNLAGFQAATALNLYASRGWTTVAWGFYGIALRFLEAQFNIVSQFIGNLDHPVFAFGYDWRQSNVVSGAALLTFIGQVLQSSNAKQVILATHSMGGLVARSALAQNPGVAASIRGVVHCAQPADGAVVAYRRFFTGANSSFDGTDVPSRVLESIMGTTPDEYASFLSDLPGPMQLMPNDRLHLKQNPNAPWLKTSPQIDLSTVFQAYALANPPGILRPAGAVVDPNNPFFGTALVNAALMLQILQAQAFHGMVGNTAHPKTHVLFSSGRRTDAQVDWSDPTRLVVTQSATGDGTVPQASGGCLNFPSSSVKSREEFQGLDHSGVLADPAFNDAVRTRVQLLLSSP